MRAVHAMMAQTHMTPRVKAAQVLPTAWRQKYKQSSIAITAQASAVVEDCAEANIDDCSTVIALKKRKLSATPKAPASKSRNVKSADAAAATSEVPTDIRRLRTPLPPITAATLPAGVAHIARVDPGVFVHQFTEPCACFVRGCLICMDYKLMFTQVWRALWKSMAAHSRCCSRQRAPLARSRVASCRNS